MLGKIFNKNDKFDQGNFSPKNPEKCVNSKKGKPIIYRSNWEKRFMVFCDMNTNVVSWGSELFEIPYIYEIDNKLHRYYPDFYLEMKNSDGKIAKYLIEIKPKKQMSKPNPPKRKTEKSTKNYNYAICEYVKNNNKWKYARMFCETRDIKFKILNEDILF